MAEQVARVQWSRVAADNLAETAEFLRQISTATEQKTMHLLIAKATQLERNPQQGQIWAHSPARDVEIRTLLVARHYRLVYEVVSPDLVTILQVLDMRRNNTYYR